MSWHPRPARAWGARLIVAVVLAATVTAGCASVSGGGTRPPRPARGQASYLAQFDTLWNRFAAVYPSFRYKGVDWQRQRALYRDRAARARSQDELIAIARAMLEPLRDMHVWFVSPQGEVVPTYRPARALNFDRRRWNRALAETGYAERAPGLGEATVGGYGYLFLGTWKPPVDADQLDLALARAREMPGLIIDVRTNAGGTDATALAFASRFATRSFPASYTQIRSGPGFDELNEPVARSVGARGPWQYARPVVIIAGRGGLSATESFVAIMRTLPHVTVIGDTTGGSSGNPATHALGNGWQFTVPRWMEYTPERLPIEGRGVAPHVAIGWSPGDYSDDRDPLIDAAVGILGERNGFYRVAPAEGEPRREPAPRGPGEGAASNRRIR